jgi:Arc/MetJ family transcription regulator
MHMRTTVDIDDGLLERAKRFALKEKKTLAAVVGQAPPIWVAEKRPTRTRRSSCWSLTSTF